MSVSEPPHISDKSAPGLHDSSTLSTVVLSDSSTLRQ